VVRKSSAARGGHSGRPRRAGSGSRRSNGRGGDRARAIAREGPRASTRGSIRFGRGAPLAVARETHLRRQLLLLRPSRASAMAVQFPGPPSLWICSRRSASSCAVNRRVGRVRRRSRGAISNRAVERRGRGGATPRVAGSEKSRSGKVLTVDAGCSTSIRLRSRGAPRARVRGRAHLRRPGVLHHLLVLILRVRHRRERSLSGSCARRAREKCKACRLNGGGVDDRRGVVRSTLRLKKAEAKSAFSFAAFERSGVNRLGGVGENPTRSIASRPSFSSRASPFFPATLSDSVGHANPRSRRFPHSKRRFSRESDQDADRRIERSAGCLSGRARPIAPAFDTATRLARGSAPRFSVRAARLRF